MLNSNSTILGILLGVIILMASVESRAQLSGEIVIVEEPVAGDLYVAGGEIEVLAPVDGDAVLAGGTLRILNRIDGDLISAGGNLRLIGSVTDDARLAGGRIIIQGKVSGHAVAAGGDVRIMENARVDDFAWLAGGSLNIAGTVGSDLKAAGGDIVLSGRVDGNAELTGNSIRINETAIINGNLTWSSPNEPLISESAEIAGEITSSEFPVSGWEPQRDGTSWLGGIFFVITVTITAGLIFSIFPAWSNDLAGSVRQRPIASPLIGLAVMATTPIVIVILFMTGVGVLLGLLVTFSYGLFLLLGWLSGVIAAACLLISLAGKPQPTTTKMAWPVIFIVAVITALFGSVPILGLILVGLIFFYGLGSLALNTYLRLQNART